MGLMHSAHHIYYFHSHRTPGGGQHKLYISVGRVGIEIHPCIMLGLFDAAIGSGDGKPI